MFKLVTEKPSNENDLLSLSLDDIARLGAKRLLTHALQLEVDEYISSSSHLVDKTGKKVVVRNGKGKPRNLTVGSGTMEIEAPRINDRRDGVTFTSQILPPYARKSPNVESVLPILYLKGLSGNAFYDALHSLLGDGVTGLSSSSISLLKKSWIKDLHQWNQRPIEDHFIYLWADGVNVKVRFGMINLFKMISIKKTSIFIIT